MSCIGFMEKKKREQRKSDYQTRQVFADITLENLNDMPSSHLLRLYSRSLPPARYIPFACASGSSSGEVTVSGQSKAAIHR